MGSDLYSVTATEVKVCDAGLMADKSFALFEEVGTLERLLDRTVDLLERGRLDTMKLADVRAWFELPGPIIAATVTMTDARWLDQLARAKLPFLVETWPIDPAAKWTKGPRRAS